MAGVTSFFKMGIGFHGLGVLDKAVPIEHSHGPTENGKTPAPPSSNMAMALPLWQVGPLAVHRSSV